MKLGLLVTGDRDWADKEDSPHYKVVLESLQALKEGYDHITLFQGKAPGADTVAERIGLALGFRVRGEPAYWNCRAYEQATGKRCVQSAGLHSVVHGRPAGILRNSRMLNLLREERVDEFLCLAFHDDLKEKSRGTKDMANKAIKAGILTINIKSNGEQEILNE